MIFRRIIYIYGIALDGLPWESYFLASILVFLHQKVLSCASVHNNTYNSPRQDPPGGINIENNVEIKSFRSIYLCQKIFSKILMFCLKKPVISEVYYQWTLWYHFTPWLLWAFFQIFTVNFGFSDTDLPRSFILFEPLYGRVFAL